MCNTDKDIGTADFDFAGNITSTRPITEKARPVT
jgi:hypothetical protein